MKADKALTQAIKNCQKHIEKVESDILLCIKSGEVEMKLYKTMENKSPLPGAVIQWLRMQDYEICDHADYFMINWKYKKLRTH